MFSQALKSQNPQEPDFQATFEWWFVPIGVGLLIYYIVALFVFRRCYRDVKEIVRFMPNVLLVFIMAMPHFALIIAAYIEYTSQGGKMDNDTNNIFVMLCCINLAFSYVITLFIWCGWWRKIPYCNEKFCTINEDADKYHYVGQGAGLMNLAKGQKQIVSRGNMAALGLLLVPIAIYVGVGYLVNGNADDGAQ